MEKKLFEPEAAVASGCNGQTSPQNNVSGNSLTSVSVINILKDRVFFLENTLSKKDLIIDFLSNKLITSKRSKSHDSTNSSRSVNIHESITVDNYANDTIKETTNERKKSTKKPAVIINGDLLLDGRDEKGIKKLSKNNRVKIKNFPVGTSETNLEEVEELVKSKPDTHIVHAETNDLTKRINVLNDVRKIYILNR